MKWIQNWLSNNSSRVEQEIAVLGDKRNSLISPESNGVTEFDPADIQTEKRQRKMDEQGFSSNSHLTCHMDLSLSSDFAGFQKTRELKNKMDCLSARHSDVLTELEHAEFQPGKKRRKEVDHWLTAVQGKKDEVQSMIKDGQGSSSNSNLIQCFIKEVDELIQRGKFPNGLVLLDQKSTRFPLSVGKKPVGINFQQNTVKILGWLRNHEHCIIGVYGMGGVGKTRLLAHIHDQLLQDSNLSGHVYWVTVSQNCSVRTLQEEIAKVLGLTSFQEDDERKRAAVLHCRITKMGRIVLILDDMWEQVSRSKVGIPLENCKVILSTRLYDVCRKMGCKDFVIMAEILHEGEAWDLFVEKLEHYDTLEDEAKKIAWDVAKECGGLPLAIATIACSMTGVVDINEWKNALNELKFARDQADMTEDVFRILQYSYDRLNDKRVQKCFLSCILYGEDARIRRTTLIDLWINEGLLDEIENRDAQVAKGHVILNKLENCCLLESTLGFCYEKCVKMHDLIRDMAIIITKEHPLFIAEAGNQLKQVPEEEKWSKDLVKVSLSDNKIDEIPSAMAPMTPNLKVLMLSGNPLEEIPDSFFVHMRALTLLDLSGTFIERVPESVSDLENLRGLLLVYCEELIYVPSVAKLTKLRTLDLDSSFNLEKAPKGLERLKCVEKVSYIPWDVSDIIGFNKVIQSLTSLNSYRIWIRDPTLFELTYDWSIFCTYDKMMLIKGGEYGGDKSSILVPTTLEYLVIEELEIKGRSLGHVFQSVGEATGLKEITIKDCTGLEYVSGSSWTQQGSSSLCPQLEYLRLTRLPDLRSIAKLGAQDSFSHLRELYISGCPKMKVVVSVTCTKQLLFANLEIINVSYCEQVREIFESNEDIPSNPILSLPNLKQLVLRNLPQLGNIYRGLLLCTSLVNPTQFMDDCPKLKVWPVAGGLTFDEPWSTMES